MNIRPKHPLLICLIVAILLSLFSCKEKQSTEPSGPPSAIIPLKVGNCWTSEYTFYDTLGNIIRTMVDSFNVVRDTILDNETWYATQYVRSTVFANKADGYYNRFQDYGSPNKTITLQWKYPAKPNDSTYIPYTYTVVVSISDQITVKAGTFTCYQYRWRYNSYPPSASVGHEEAWLSPNIGRIKSLGYRKLASGEEYLYHKAELISYRLY